MLNVYLIVVVLIVAILYITRSKYPFMLSSGDSIKRVVLQTALLGIGLVVCVIAQKVEGALTGNYRLISGFGLADLLLFTLVGYAVINYRYFPWGTNGRIRLRVLAAILISFFLTYFLTKFSKGMMDAAGALLIPAFLLLLRGISKIILGDAWIYQGTALSPTHYISKDLEVKLVENKSAENIRDKFNIHLRYSSGKKHDSLVANLRKRYGNNLEYENVVAEFDGPISAADINWNSKYKTSQWEPNLSWGYQEKTANRTAQETTTSTMSGGTSLGLTSSGDMVFVDNPSRTVTHYGKTYSYTDHFGIFELFLFFTERTIVPPEFDTTGLDPIFAQEPSFENRSLVLFLKYFDKRAKKKLDKVLHQIKKTIEDGLEIENKKIRDDPSYKFEF